MMQRQKFDRLFAPATLGALGAWLCLISLSWPVMAQDQDERGRLIATPAESELIERGYLFYPHRALPIKDKTTVNATVPAPVVNDGLTAAASNAVAAASLPAPAEPTAKTSKPSSKPAPAASAPAVEQHADASHAVAEPSDSHHADAAPATSEIGRAHV